MNNGKRLFNCAIEDRNCLRLQNFLYTQLFVFFSLHPTPSSSFRQARLRSVPAQLLLVLRQTVLRTVPELALEALTLNPPFRFTPARSRRFIQFDDRRSFSPSFSQSSVASSDVEPSAQNDGTDRVSRPAPTVGRCPHHDVTGRS